MNERMNEPINHSSLNHLCSLCHHRLLVVLLRIGLVVRSRLVLLVAPVRVGVGSRWINKEPPGATICWLHGLVVALGARVVFREDVVLALGAHPVARSERLGEACFLVLLYDLVHFSHGILSLFAPALLTVVTEAKLVDLADGTPPVSAAKLVPRALLSAGRASSIPVTTSIKSATTTGAILKMVETTGIALVTLIVLPRITDVRATRAVSETSTSSAIVSVSTSTAIPTFLINMLEATGGSELAITLLVGVANIGTYWFQFKRRYNIAKRERGKRK